MIKKYIKFFLFTCLCFIIADTFVNADTLYNNGSITFFNNNGSSVNQLTTDYNSQIDESSAIITTNADSYGGLVVLQLSNPLIKNHIYTLFLNVGAESNGGYTMLSSKNCLGIGNSVSNSANNYVNNCITPKFSDYTSSTGDKTRGIYYTFIATSDNAFLAVPYTSQYTCHDCRNYSYGYTINDGGDTTGLTESQVNNLISNQTTIIKNQINDNFNDCITNVLNPSSYTIVSDRRWNLTSYDLGTFQFTLKSSYTGSGGNFPLGWIVDLKPNTYYTFQANNAVNSTAKLYWYIYTNDWSSNLFYYTENPGLESFTFKTGTATRYFIQLYLSGSYSEGDTVTISNISLIEGQSGSSTYIPYGEPSCVNKIDQTNDKLDNIDDTLKNDDTTNATNQAGGFFNDFTTDTHGLTAIITAPLSLIESITSSTCSPLVIPLPYVDKDLTLPCMGTIYSNYFGSFLSIYQMITFGIVAYWVCVRIFNLVKDFKNPDHDEIEVLDL